MLFMHTDAKCNTISSNWHTDNVGSRIKVFVCIEGDGSQPTLILRPRKNINSFNYLFKIYFSELFRWSGMNFKRELQNAKFLRHHKGSIFAFDYPILYRVGYKLASTNRNVLVIEFSNPNKHKLLSKGILKDPIGTNKYNKFKLNKIKNIPTEINCFLDKKRLHYEGNSVSYR